MRHNAALISRLQPALVGDAKDVGQARALDVVRHDRQRRVHARAVDAAHAGVVAVAEICEPSDAFAQRELERRHGRQRRIDAKDLHSSPVDGVGGNNAVANAVGEQRRLRVVLERGAQTWRDPLCNGRTTTLCEIARKGSLHLVRPGFTGLSPNFKSVSAPGYHSPSCTSGKLPVGGFDDVEAPAPAVIAAATLAATLAFVPLAAQQRRRRSIYDAIYRIKAGGIPALAGHEHHELADRRLRSAAHQLARLPQGRRVGGEGDDRLGARQREARTRAGPFGSGWSNDKFYARRRRQAGASR